MHWSKSRCHPLLLLSVSPASLTPRNRAGDVTGVFFGVLDPGTWRISLLRCSNVSIHVATCVCIYIHICGCFPLGGMPTKVPKHVLQGMFLKGNDWSPMSKKIVINQILSASQKHQPLSNHSICLSPIQYTEQNHDFYGVFNINQGTIFMPSVSSAEPRWNLKTLQ